MHCYGGNALVMFSDYYGIEYIFTPTYSKHPVERAFSKIKSVISRPEFSDLVHDNLAYAIYCAVGYITSADCVGYYRIAEMNTNLIWISVAFILQGKCLHFCAVQCECSISYHTYFFVWKECSVTSFLIIKTCIINYIIYYFHVYW